MNIFNDTEPVPHWFFRQQKQLWPYDNPTTEKLEENYQKFKKRNGPSTFQIFELKIDFEKMTSFRKGATKQKTLARGTWFYLDDCGTHCLYEPDVADKLEKALLVGFFRVEVCSKPFRYVIYEGEGLFRQYRQSKNAQPHGRTVRRGWMGSMRKIGTDAILSPPYVMVESPRVSPLSISQYLGPTQNEIDELQRKGLTSYTNEDLKRYMPAVAKGSYGIIFRGSVSNHPAAEIAIKDIVIRDQKSIKEWNEELSTMMMVAKCPYVALVFGFSYYESTLTIVMEFLPRGDLFTLIHKKKEPLHYPKRLLMARQVAGGIKYLHQNKILHRDLKSLNILLTKDFYCKITDFGLAKLLGDQSVVNTANAGSPMWMAPEVKEGPNYEFSADIYSLGLVLFEIFEKHLPDWDTIQSKVSLPGDFPSASVVLPCVDYNPKQRPEAEEVVDMLDNNVISELVGKFLDEISVDEREQVKKLSTIEGQLQMLCKILDKMMDPDKVDQLSRKVLNVEEKTIFSTTPGRRISMFPSYVFRRKQCDVQVVKSLEVVESGSDPSL